MKIIVVAGARPNFMKVAPILEAFRIRKQIRTDLEVLLVHTGQHYDQRMSDDFFQDLGMPHPDVNLGVGSGTHAQQTARVMTAFEDVCFEHRPDFVIVVGDVNSTVACAITAKKLGIQVAHVEAGLRSRDMSMPEEINRLCTDAISDLLFTTDAMASENLRREGVPEAKIHFVGNTMVDTLLRHIARAREMPLPDGITPKTYAVLTLHRPSNVDREEILCGLFGAIRAVAEKIRVVFPAHPRTVARMNEYGLMRELNGRSNVRVLEPMSYLPFLSLVSKSRMVMTDSGGIQEETTMLGVPCLTMRENTERPVTCEQGTNVLVGTNPARIRTAALSALNAIPRKGCAPEKWDGRAAGRIADLLLQQNVSRAVSAGVCA